WFLSSSSTPTTRKPPFARWREPAFISVKSVTRAPNLDSYSILPKRLVAVGLSSAMTGAPFNSELSTITLTSYLRNAWSESLLSTGFRCSSSGLSFAALPSVKTSVFFALLLHRFPSNDGDDHDAQLGHPNSVSEILSPFVQIIENLVPIRYSLLRGVVGSRDKLFALESCRIARFACSMKFFRSFWKT